MKGVPPKVILRHAHLAPEARESAVHQLDHPLRQFQAAPARSAEGHTGDT
ncbi:hypothetical protein [Cystobacter fuscus]